MSLLLREPREMTVLLVDIPSRRVGCVLMQAIAKCSRHDLYRLGFGTETWFYAPTQTMQKISGTDDEWRRYAEICTLAAKARSK